jgi:hypothetical protein
MVERSYRNLALCEQNPNSPHRYLTDTLEGRKISILCDVGAAEGMLALTLIDKVDQVFIFEVEDIWMEPLRATFGPWKDKVTLVNKFASDCDEGEYITLDTILADSEGSKLIKLDVEGAEMQVLNGAKRQLKSDDAIFVCCTYHREEDAEVFESLFRDYGYNTEYTNGYILFGNEPPFFRKGLIMAWK